MGVVFAKHNDAVTDLCSGMLAGDLVSVRYAWPPFSCRDDLDGGHESVTLAGNSHNVIVVFSNLAERPSQDTNMLIKAVYP